MKEQKIFECEVLIWFAVDEKREQRWIVRSVKDIEDGQSVRCRVCRENVRIHRKRINHGPEDHVEHLIRNRNCELSGGSK